MLVKAIKARPFIPPKDDLFPLIKESFLNVNLKEKSIIVGNVYTHMAGFTEADIVSVYVCEYGKNNQRGKIKMDIAHP